MQKLKVMYQQKVLQTFEGSKIKGDINSSNTSIGGALKVTLSLIK